MYYIEYNMTGVLLYLVAFKKPIYAMLKFRQYIGGTRQN
jgi:hypothetical protein